MAIALGASRRGGWVLRGLGNESGEWVEKRPDWTNWADWAGWARLTKWAGLTGLTCQARRAADRVVVIAYHLGHEVSIELSFFERVRI
jgi:hypothetical protein